MKVIKGDDQDYVEIDVDRVVREKEKAYLLEVGDMEEWFPKSEVDVDLETMKVVMPSWLYDKKFCS